MSSSEPIENECSAEGLLRGGKGEISVSLVSWANVSFRRRRLRLLFGVVRERRDTAFFIAGLSFWSAERKKKAHGKHKATYVKTKEWKGHEHFLQIMKWMRSTKRPVWIIYTYSYPSFLCCMWKGTLRFYSSSWTLSGSCHSFLTQQSLPRYCEEVQDEALIVM